MSQNTKAQRRPPPLSANHTPYMLLGHLVIVLVFVGLGGWAAMARLDSAVVASGKVAAKSNRKTVQHLEGGIVESIHVREGQLVREGELLMRLHPTLVQASRNMQQNQLDAVMALEARLAAESSKSDSIEFPRSLMERENDPQVRLLIRDQQRQFAERRSSLEGQVSILTSKIEQLKRAVAGLLSSEEAAKSQLAIMRAERDKVGDLNQRGLYPSNRLNTLDREILELKGRAGQLEADISRTEQAIGETELQILQTELKFQEDVAKELRDVRVQVAEAQEKVQIARDVFARLELRATSSGMVQNLKQHTIGGVVRAGDAILEIAPVDDRLHVHARVATFDVHYVRPRLDAEVRFPGFKGRSIPVMLGKVQTVSRDLLIDEQTREPYYLAIVEVDDKELPDDLRSTLTAGVPTEVIIATGERTVADYLLSPLINSARVTMREQ